MFKLLKKSAISAARLGVINTAHGQLNTPAFLPDATRATVKLTDFKELQESGVEALVVNTYHLYLKPGTKIIKKSGGMHNFSGWNRPLLSDSGGYQVFSLIHKHPGWGKIKEDEVIFKSPENGATVSLNPEEVIKIQFDLGTDMMVCLDDCPPNEAGLQPLRDSIARTIVWAKRCRREYEKQCLKRKLSQKNRPLLFAVIQGGEEQELRRFCAEELKKEGFDGYGFGARPVDERGNFLGEILEFTAAQIPETAIRFALGVGEPEDIVRSAARGWDLFDCVIPTREGRHGKIFQFLGQGEPNLKLNSRGELAKNFYYSFNITNSKFASDQSPVNQASRLEPLRLYSKAYLNYLFKINEPLGQKLASLNNLEFYNNLMKLIRKKITDGII